MPHLARRELLATLASIASAVVADHFAETTTTELLPGVVDRIEEDVAAVLVERAGAAVGERRVALERLPVAARESGAVLELSVEGDRLADVRYDAGATHRRRAAAAERLEGVATERSDGRD